MSDELKVGDKVRIANNDRIIDSCRGRHGVIVENKNNYGTFCVRLESSGIVEAIHESWLTLVEPDMSPAFEGPIVGFQSGDKPKEHRHGCGVRYDLLVPEFIEGMAKVIHKGASKYGPDNWKKGLTGENSGLNHAMKHIGEYQMGKPCDFGDHPEDHMFQVAVNAMFEWYLTRQKRLDTEGK